MKGLEPMKHLFFLSTGVRVMVFHMTRYIICYGENLMADYYTTHEHVIGHTIQMPTLNQRIKTSKRRVRQPMKMCQLHFGRGYLIVDRLIRA